MVSIYLHVILPVVLNTFGPGIYWMCLVRADIILNHIVVLRLK